METGEALGTDRLMDNLIAFLIDPWCNHAPNGSFELCAGLPGARSNWLIITRGGAKSRWTEGPAAAGERFLRLNCPDRRATALVRPYKPLIVEPRRRYLLAFRYRSDVQWSVELRSLGGPYPKLPPQRSERRRLEPASSWRQYRSEWQAAEAVTHLQVEFTVRGPGWLELDDVQFREVR
jgi:hypothetical protein